MKEEYNFKEILKDLRYDEITLIFGFENGGYLTDIENIICEKNKVYIFEPNENIYNNHKHSIKNANIKLISIQDENLEVIMESIITLKTFLNINIQICEDTSKTYKEEYEKFINLVDNCFYKCQVSLMTNDTFKYQILDNLLSNICEINNSYKFDDYININKGIPAIIVSAGPSLDKNIKTLLNYKDKINKFFIIAGNRTIKPLKENNIIPDVVVSVDPQDITFDMMKDNFDDKVPLIYSEKSNKKLVKNYKAMKIALSQGIINNIENLKDMKTCVSGGSVAHVACDIAFLLGCNPIIFIGQDFGYTYGKEHADIAKNKLDKEIDFDDLIMIKDINNQDIQTTKLLNLYKNNLENLIKLYKINKNEICFINASYGANIEGCPHKRLEELMDMEYTTVKKNITLSYEKIAIDNDKIVKSLNKYINDTIDNCDKSIYICKEIAENPKIENLKQFPFILDTIDNFVKDEKSIYIYPYIQTFLVYIKNKLFNMKASEYNTLSKDLVYQSLIFNQYMIELKLFLNEIKSILTHNVN